MQPGVQTGECGQNKWEDGVWTLWAAPWMGSPLYTCPPCHGAPTSVAGSTRQGPACWGPLDAPYRSDRHALFGERQRPDSTACRRALGCFPVRGGARLGPTTHSRFPTHQHGRASYISPQRRCCLGDSGRHEAAIKPQSLPLRGCWFSRTVLRVETTHWGQAEDQEGGGGGAGTRGTAGIGRSGSRSHAPASEAGAPAASAPPS